jgi:hypothetical protein
MWYLWQSLNILNIIWIYIYIVDWFPTFLKFCEITALSTFFIMSKSSNVFFFQPKVFFYLFKINVANITEWWKRQLKYSSYFTINQIYFRNCGVFFFFACCIIKVWCCVDIAMHARLLNTKYTLFTAFHTLIRARGL